MKTKLITFCGAAAFAAASVATAAISFTLELEVVKDSSNQPINDEGLLVLVVDTANNGFSQPVAGEIVPAASDDEIVATWDLSTAAIPVGQDYLQLLEGGIAYSGTWQAGQKLALIWFPGLAGSETPAADEEYGFFTDVHGLASGDTWTLPADNAFVHSLKLFTSIADNLVSFGDFPDGLGKAMFAVNNPASSVDAIAVVTTTSNNSKIDITWQGGASSSGGFIIQRSRPGTGNWRTVGFATNDATTFEDDSITAGLDYEYRVLSANGFSYSVAGAAEAVEAERSRFINLASRAHIVPGSPNRDWTLVNAGIILAGNDTNKRMLGIGIGPYNDNRLPDDWLQDTTMLLEKVARVNDVVVVTTEAQNDDWMHDSTNPAAPNPDVMAIEAAMVARGTPLLPADDPDNGFVGMDSAIIHDITLGDNIFKVFPKSASNRAGNVGIQVYDAEYEGEDNPVIHDNRIVNLSSKGYLSPGGVFNGSLIIEGDVPKEVLVLARGPALALKGIQGVLDDTKLILRRTNDVLLENDDWDQQVAASNPARGLISVETDMSRIRAAIVSVGQNPDDHTKDSVMLVKLAPGPSEGYIFKIEAGPNSVNGAGTVQIQINEIEME